MKANTPNGFDSLRFVDDKKYFRQEDRQTGPEETESSNVNFETEAMLADDVDFES